MFRLLLRSSSTVCPQHPLRLGLTMPTTRSASRAATAALANVEVPGPAIAVAAATKKTATKRKSPATKVKVQASKKARSAQEDAKLGENIPSVPKIDEARLSTLPRPATPPVLVPATLTFSFEDAKQHLIAADHRFEGVFSRMKCRPFEHLEQVDPFRSVFTLSCLR